MPTIPVRKADNRRGRLLSSPGVQNAMMQDTVISAATSSSETQIYHIITFQFISFVFDGAKIFPPSSFINTKMFIFALIKSINRAL